MVQAGLDDSYLTRPTAGSLVKASRTSICVQDYAVCEQIFYLFGHVDCACGWRWDRVGSIPIPMPPFRNHLNAVLPTQVHQMTGLCSIPRAKKKVSRCDSGGSLCRRTVRHHGRLSELTPPSAIIGGDLHVSEQRTEG